MSDRDEGDSSDHEEQADPMDTPQGTASTSTVAQLNQLTGPTKELLSTASASDFFFSLTISIVAQTNICILFHNHKDSTVLSRFLPCILPWPHL